MIFFGAKFVAVGRTVYISMEYLETNIEQIRLWVKENYTHRMISDTLKSKFFGSNERVFGKNIRLFCSQHEIHKQSDLKVDSIVEDSIREVCIPKVEFARYLSLNSPY